MARTGAGRQDKRDTEAVDNMCDSRAVDTGRKAFSEIGG
jgi:hypothetical protein